MTPLSRAGRPPIGPQRSVRCTADEWDAVDRVAAQHGAKPATMARRLILLGLAAIADQATPDRDQEDEG